MAALAVDRISPHNGARQKGRKRIFSATINENGEHVETECIQHTASHVCSKTHFNTECPGKIFHIRENVNTTIKWNKHDRDEAKVYLFGLRVYKGDGFSTSLGSI